MDDCNLEKLSIKPGKLSPVFKMCITDYSVTLPSNIEKLTIDYLTRDSGASCVILVGLNDFFCEVAMRAACMQALGQLKKKMFFIPARPSKPSRLDIFFIFYFTQIQVIIHRRAAVRL
jgi:hypothetical protein